MYPQHGQRQIPEPIPTAASQTDDDRQEPFFLCLIFSQTGPDGFPLTPTCQGAEEAQVLKVCCTVSQQEGLQQHHAHEQQRTP